ncbi:MAG: choice-of-anchor J domain-containing protein, partial [Spirochaetia bacterium]
KWARRTNIMRTGSASAGMENQFTGSQEDDWLITPGITVTENSELRFYRLSAWYDLYKYNGVWVSTDDQDPANFSELEELGEAPDDGWHFYSIDLSDYAGQTIYAAFVYTYTNSVGDSFYIDDVEITQ